MTTVLPARPPATDLEAPRRPRVYIVYNCISRYRLPLFRVLARDPAVEFTIVSDTASDTPYMAVASPDELQELRHVPVRTRTLSRFSFQPRALALVNAQRPDVLIVLPNPYSLTAWSLCAMGRLRGIPVLLWGHGLLTDERGPKWWIRGLLYRLAAGHLVYGDHANALLVKKGFPKERVRTVYNSLDLDAQSLVAEALGPGDLLRFRAAAGIPAHERAVAFVGRLQPAKRLDLLLDAVKMLDRRGRTVHVVLIGNGSARDALEQLASRHAIRERVHFLGECHDERTIGVALSASDLCVIPGAAGLTIMHAFAYGVPVLLDDRRASHGPEWEAVEEGVTGMYYRHGAAEDLAAKMDAALFPVPLKETAGDRCRQVIRERYNPHVQARIFVETALTYARSRRSCGGAPGAMP